MVCRRHLLQTTEVNSRALNSNSSWRTMAFVIWHHLHTTQPGMIWLYKHSRSTWRRLLMIHWRHVFLDFFSWNRLIPHTTTGISLAEFLLGWVPRSLLDLLKPKPTEPEQDHPQLADAVKQKQQKQKGDHDNRLKLREFVVGDPVFVKDFPEGKKWITGTVTAVKGPLSYHVTLTDGRVMRRHVDHIRSRTSTRLDDNLESDLIDIPTPPTPNAAVTGPAVPPTAPPLRRSTRNANPPDWLRDYVCTMVWASS